MVFMDTEDGAVDDCPVFFHVREVFYQMDILESVLDEFKHLAAIPRANGHEKAVSDFLKQYLTDAGFTVV